MSGLDAASEQLVKQVRESGTPPLSEQTPEHAREFGAALRDLIGPGPDMVAVRDHSVPTADGSAIAVRCLIPTEYPRGVVVFFHGGGWVIGSIDDTDCACRMLAEQTGCVVVAVGYRLAPEHPFPSAVDDAWDAVLWVAANRAKLGAPEGPLILVGDSAGGNLAAVTSSRARAANTVDVDLQVLVNPVLDADLDRPSYLDPARQLLLTRESMVWFWDHYLPDHGQRRLSDASPLRSDDFRGLPATVLVLPELDILHDEAEAYVEVLRDNDVPVTVCTMAGQLHGFFTLVNLLPGATAGIAIVAEHVVASIK